MRITVVGGGIGGLTAAVALLRAGELQAQARDAGNEFFLEEGPEERERDERLRPLPATQPFGTRQRVWEYDVRDALAAAANGR